MLRCVPTPYSILNGDDTRDVFSEIIPDSEQYATEKRAVLWAVYGDTGIGNPDVDYWIRRMKGRYHVIGSEYDLKIQAWEKLVDEGVGFDDHVLERESSGTDTVTGKDSASSSGSKHQTSTNDLSNKVFDPAQQAAAPTAQYLSEMTTDTGSVSVLGSDSSESSTSRNESRDSKSSESMKESSGLTSERFKRFVDSAESPFSAFADEFGDFFYWGM